MKRRNILEERKNIEKKKNQEKEKTDKHMGNVPKDEAGGVKKRKR